MRRVTDIAIHYVGNPGTSAQANRNYFAQPDAQVSAHFLIGLEGEIIQCIPLNEKSSATNDRNRDTISIEVCHPRRHGAVHPGQLRRPGAPDRLAVRLLRHRPGPGDPPLRRDGEALPPVLRGARGGVDAVLGGCGGLLRPGPRPALPGGPPLPKSAGGPVGTGAG